MARSIFSERAITGVLASPAVAVELAANPIAALTVESTNKGGHAEAASAREQCDQETGSRGEASPRHPHSQTFPAPVAAARRSCRPGSLAASARVPICQPLEIAKHNRHAILFGQP